MEAGKLEVNCELEVSQKLKRETISRSKVMPPMPNAAEKVKDSETKMGPLNLVIKRFLVISAKSSFYKTKNPGFPGLTKLKNLTTNEESAYP